MLKKHAVVQKFWARVFNTPGSPALLIRNPNPEPQLVVLPHPMGLPATTLITPPAYFEVSHESMGMAVAAISAFLHKNGFKAGDRAAIMAWNCPEWVFADIAIQSLGGVTVPIYPHSTPEQVNYVLRDSGALYLFSNEDAQLQKVDPTASVRAVHFDDLPSLLTGVVAEQRKSYVLNFHPPDEMTKERAGLWCAAKGQMRWFERALAQNGFAFGESDIATIIYTSGSTGTPKGVVLTHSAFIAACEGMLGHGFTLNPRRDVYLSYLPLAHVYERAAGMMLCLWSGVPMAFCKVDEVGETIKLVRPSLLHGVPAVWRKVKEKIDSGIGSATGVKAKLIAWAFAQKDSGFKHWLADFLVFSKIRSELGGRLRICTSGGAPISPEILQFYRKIGVPVLQGYGLTETTGPTAVELTDDSGNKVGSVGPVLNTMGVRIALLPGQEDAGDGEIQFHGLAVTPGYWNLPGETQKAFTEDGWFKTGDRGRMDADGYLYITGRIKRLLKTDGGKYVAPEKIEKAFEGDPLVQYVVPVGDGKPYICGLVFLNQQLARETLMNRGVPVPVSPDAAASYYAHHPQVKQLVEAAVANANSKLERWEQLKKFQIVTVEAGIANGLLTPTLKIRTEEVLQRYADLVDAFYAKPKA